MDDSHSVPHTGLSPTPSYACLQETGKGSCSWGLQDPVLDLTIPRPCELCFRTSIDTALVESNSREPGGHWALTHSVEEVPEEVLAQGPFPRTRILWSRPHWLRLPSPSHFSHSWKG
jgi:hypothetical protein